MMSETLISYIQALKPEWIIGSKDAEGFSFENADVVLTDMRCPEIRLADCIDIRSKTLRSVMREINALNQAATKQEAENVSAARLTTRERQVLQYLCQGQSNKEIARALGLQVATIKLHVRNVCRKLGARNRTQAVLIAQRFSVH